MYREDQMLKKLEIEGLITRRNPRTVTIGHWNKLADARHFDSVYLHLREDEPALDRRWLKPSLGRYRFTGHRSGADGPRPELRTLPDAAILASVLGRVKCRFCLLPSCLRRHPRRRRRPLPRPRWS